VHLEENEGAQRKKSRDPWQKGKEGEKSSGESLFRKGTGMERKEKSLKKKKQLEGAERKGGGP